jgi:transketolase
MRKQFITTVENILNINETSVLLLGDIGIYGFRKSFEKYPKRVYNIGILEQSTISLAAGLSSAGLIPIVHTIAPFLVERAFEQLKIDFGYQSLGGNFISIGSSYDYASLGCTHHCPGDISLLLTIPNMQIVCPGNSHEFDELFNQSYDNNQPTYFRLSEYENNKINDKIIFGKANLIKKSEHAKALIVVVGNLLENTIEAVEDLNCDILYYTTISPFDVDSLRENFNENIIVIEPFYEGSINYQINSALKGQKYKLTNIGVPRKFLTNYGTKLEHDLNLGLDSNSLREKIKNEL